MTNHAPNYNRNVWTGCELRYRNPTNYVIGATFCASHCPDADRIPADCNADCDRGDLSQCPTLCRLRCHACANTAHPARIAAFEAWAEKAVAKNKHDNRERARVRRFRDNMRDKG